MKKLIPFCLALLLLAACSNKQQNEYYYLPDNADNEAFFGIVERFTSGAIGPNATLMVQFCQGATLKLQQGETIPSKAFEFEPKVKGKTLWIDERTIGFQIDPKTKTHEVYQMKLHLDAFVETPKNLPPLESSFIIFPQDFHLTDCIYRTTEDDRCNYDLILDFRHTTSPDDAINLLDRTILTEYPCSATALNENKIALSINNIPRKNSEYQLDITLDGKALENEKKISEKLRIPAIGQFEVMSHSINKKERTVSVFFSNPLNVKQSMYGRISCSNELSNKTEITNNCLAIYFDYNYYLLRQSFDLTINRELCDHQNQILLNNYLIPIDNLNARANAPEVRWADDGDILPYAQNSTLRFDAIALKSVTLRITKVYDDNMPTFLRNNDLDDTYNVKQVGRLMKKIKLYLDNDNYSEWKTYPIQLADYVPVKDGNLYQISIDFDLEDYPFACTTSDDVEKYQHSENDYWDDEDYRFKPYYYSTSETWNDPCSPSFYNDVSIRKNVLVSDIGISAKTAYEGSIDVFVQKISTTEPLSGYAVQLLDNQLHISSEGTTDSDGYAHLTYQNKPILVRVQKDDATAYLRINNNQSLSLSKFDVGGTSIAEGCNGFIYSNRDIWRPGDTLQINFMLSKNHQPLPPQFPILFELYDANQRLYQKRVNNAPTGNIYSFAIATNASDETGIWRAKIKVGNQTFSKSLRVETVQPNRLKIDLTLPQIVYLSTRPSLKLSSKWLNGLTASNLKAAVDLSLSKTTTQFDKYPEYSFDNITSEFYRTTTEIFNGPLDNNGNKLLSLNNIEELDAPGFLRATFTTKVFEQSGEFSITSHQTTLSPYRRYVGVSLPKTKSKYGDYYFTNEKWSCNLLVINEDGTLPAEADVSCQLFKLNYYWWWNYDEDLSQYAHGRAGKPVLEKTIACPNGKGTLDFTIDDQNWGSYLLIVSDPAGHRYSTVLTFDTPYLAGRARTTGEAAALLSLRSDKTTYNVGDEVRIMFPANKESKALITIESTSEIIEKFTQDALGEDAVVSFKVTPEMVPNIYVFVTLFQPYNKSNDLPLRMYGVMPLTIEDPKSHLEPTITMPETTNSNSTINIKVNEKNGNAICYTLALVDEGILGLTNYHTPNPHQHFFQKQALHIRTWDNYNNIIDASTATMPSVYAAGGDVSIINQETMLSKRFSAVSMMFGPFELKKGASQTHQITIPKYIGSLRAMVVASDGNNSYGSAQKNINVKDPLMLVPSVPRIVSPNDRLTIPLQILAPELAGKQVQVTIATTNLQLKTAATQTLTINANGEAMLNVPVSVEEATGAANITFTATAGKVSVSSETTVPIRVPFTPQYQSVTKEIAPQTTETFSITAQGIEGTLSGQVSIDQGMPVNLFHRLDQLTDNPYGSLQTLATTALPQIYLHLLTPLNEETKADIKRNIENAATQIRQHQRPNNALANWVGSNYIIPWNEVLATHFLIEANDKGFLVPEDLLANVVSYQSKRAEEWRLNPDYPADEILQAYRLLVLSLKRSANIAAMNRLKSQNIQYPITKALLAATYALEGKNKVAQELMPEINLYDETNDTYYYSGSDTRNLAIMTFAKMLTDGNSNHVKPYINHLCQTLSSQRYLNYESTAFALFVLGKYAEMNGYKNDNISVLANINGNEKNLSGTMPSISEKWTPKQGNNQIAITNPSKTPIFASVYTKSTVAKHETTEQGNGFAMTVNYFDKIGNPINPNNLTRNADFYAEITIENKTTITLSENAITYLAPSGWEIINDQLFGNDNASSPCLHIDRRDDRQTFFFDLYPNTKQTFIINLNATHIGNYTVPAVHCENMSNNEFFYIIPALNVQVVD